MALVGVGGACGLWAGNAIDHRGGAAGRVVAAASTATEAVAALKGDAALRGRLS